MTPTQALLQGRDQAVRGDLYGALRSFQRALADAPGDLSAAFHCGAALLSTGQGEEALRVMSPLTSAPRPLRSFEVCQGLAWESIGQEDEALACFSRVGGRIGASEPLRQAWSRVEEPLWRFSELLQILPDTPGPLLRAGLHLERRGDVAGAAGCYQALLELSPGSRAARAALEALSDALTEAIPLRKGA